ncbi:hypothetical protein C4K38_3543 [Pseudomonas chlororaphis subsp. piscium]|nr:hypothetical protein C4K38_3543 [Pseudomonas chlororaphis subsp. piscium]SDS90392.1 hypothetical protein SAMN05216585_3845 [Pseudomonas chlororaphis]
MVAEMAVVTVGVMAVAIVVVMVARQVATPEGLAAKAITVA